MSNWLNRPHHAPLHPRRGHPDRRSRTLGAMAGVAALLVAVGAVTAAFLTTRHTPVAHARRIQSRPAAHSGTGPPQPDPTVLAVERVMRETPYIRSGGQAHRYIALTFDDGPSPYTLQIIKVLKQRHVPATFFQVGRMIPVFPGAARATSAAGFVVGDHTQNHPPLAVLGPAGQSAEIVDQVSHMRRVGEPAPRLFRPPYMSYNRTTLGLLRSLHMLMVLWTIDSEDYRQPGVPAIVYRVLSGARPGAIVLMHDGGGVRAQTVAALPLIIDALRRRHFAFVTIPELLLKDPPTPGHQGPAAAPGGAAG